MKSERGHSICGRNSRMQSDTQTISSANSVISGVIPARAYRVLVVDDDPMIRALLVAVLKRAGYETEIAKDGFAALERANQSDFDLIMSDLRMPGMWGTELYQRLKESKPELAERMVFATSESLTGDLKQFFEISGRPYLRKPFSND